MSHFVSSTLSRFSSNPSVPVSGGARPIFLPGHIQVIDPFSQVSPVLDFRPIFERFGSFSRILGRFLASLPCECPSHGPVLWPTPQTL